MGQIYGLKLSPSKRDILLAMAENADDDGNNCKPGVPYVAWKVDLSERQVQRIQKALIEDGLLVVVEKPPRKPVVYQINLSAGIQKEPYKPRDQRKGDSVSPKAMNKGDILSKNEGDNVSSDVLRVTSHGKNANAKGDIGTGKTASTHIKDEPLKDKKQQQRPRIYTLYEQLTGNLIRSQILADSLTDDAKTYPMEWIEAAVQEAAMNEARTWQYVRSILQRWQREGFKSPRKTAKTYAPSFTPPPKPAARAASTSAGVPDLAKLRGH